MADYGYRYYDPVTGRWPSRDPIEERGGDNIYHFCYNDSILKFDIRGLNVRVDFKCELISTSGKFMKSCEYECNETHREQLAWGGPPFVDDLPPPPLKMTISSQQWCWCSSNVETKRLFTADSPKIDCSRSSCRERCKAAYAIAKLSKNPVVIAAAYTAMVTCVDGCDAICNNP